NTNDSDVATANNVRSVPLTIDPIVPEYDITVTSSTSVNFVSGTGLVMPANPVFNVGMQSVGLAVDIVNNGSFPTGSYQVRLALYNDSGLTSQIAGSEQIIPGVNIAGNGTSVLSVTNLSLSTITDPGTYYLGITLDSNNELDESLVSGGESNNTIAVPLTFEDPKPDIAFSAFNVDGLQMLDAAPGDVLHVGFELINNSSVAITTPFDVNVELADASGAVVAGCIWTETISALNSQAEGNNRVYAYMDISLPFDLAISNYTLVAKADNGSIIAEADETNNTSGTVAITLKDPEIDLVLQPLATPVTQNGRFFWGSQFHFNFQINEFGDSVSPQTMAAVYLSSSADSTDGAILLQELSIPQLMPGSFYPVDSYLALPDNFDGTLTDGDYFLVVVIDSGNEVDEIINGQSAEGNNIRSTVINIGSPNIDLKVDIKSDPAAIEVIRSVPFDVPLSVFNDSMGIVDTPFTIRAVVSQDSIAGNSDDYLLGTAQVSHLDPYASFEQMLLVNWPEESVLADGIYRIIVTADVDNIVSETYADGSVAEDNNQGIFYIQLTTLELTAGVDLIAGDFDNDGGSNFGWGNSYNLYYGLLNNGMDDASSFDVDFVLSRDNNIDSNDLTIGSYTVSPGLASGMVYMSEMTVTMPENTDGALADGAYFIIMSVDGKQVIVESDEYNNTISRVISMGNLPDGTDFEVKPFNIVSTGNYGQSVTVRVPVANNGSVAQWSQLSVYASESPITLSTLANAMMLGSYDISDHGDLEPGETSEVEITIYLPTMQQGTGEQYFNLLFMVDANNSVVEFDETNNAYYHTIVMSQEILPDLQAWPTIGAGTEIKYVPGAGLAFDWGDTLTLDAQLNNWSAAEVTDSFTITYYLSSESTWSENFDSADLYQLTSKTVTGIAANGFVAVEGAVVSLPETAPSRFAGVNNLYLVSLVDSAGVINEANESNNYSDMPIYIGQVPADLGGFMEIRPESGQDYPQMNYLWGQTVPVAINMQNYGGGDAENFTVSYYLAQDWSFQNADGSLNMNKLVAVGSQVVDIVESGAGSWDPQTGSQSQSVIVNFDLVLPGEKPAGFTSDRSGCSIVAILDSGNVVSEYDDNWNNIVTNYVNIEKASSDLVGFYITPLDPETGVFRSDALWSDDTNIRQVRVTGNVANFGNVAAENLTIGFYLADASGNLNTAWELGREVISSLSHEGAANHHDFDYSFDLPVSDSVSFVTAGKETGAYSIVMVVDPDGAIDEIDEGNNVAVHPFRLEKLTGKVLISDSMGDPSDKEIDFGSLLAADQATAWVNIHNSGEGRLTVSDIMVDNQVFVVDSSILPLVIEPGHSYDLLVSLDTADLLPGTQQGVMTILTDDPRRPDGTVIDLSVVIRQDPVDLAVMSLSALTLNSESLADENADAYWGDTLRVDLSASNLAAVNTAGAAYIDLYISDPANSAAKYTLVQGYSVGQLLGQGAYNGVLEVTLPLESPFGYSGSLDLTARIYGSGQDFEQVIANNAISSVLNIVTKPEGKADIAFSYVNMAELAAPGEQLTVDFGIANNGKADAGAFAVKVYLSDNTTYNTTDTLVGTVNVQGLAVGTESARTLNFVLPDNVQEGLKYLVFMADDAGVLDESVKEDNISIARFNVEKGPETDLTVSAISVVSEVIIGSEFDIDLTITNEGTQVAQNVTVDLFLKGVDQAQTSLGTFIGTFTIDTIAAGGSFDAQYSTYMPAAKTVSGGQYNIVAVVDRQQKIEETNEQNNTTYSNILLADAGSIDLSGIAGVVPEQANWGEGFDFTLTVENSGEIASPAYSVKLVLSNDTTLSSNDIYLNSAMSKALASGESKDTQFWVWLPDDMNLTDGNYYVLAAVDSGSVVAETDENNNLVVSDAIAIAGIPDLYGYLQTVPVSANYGQTIIITDKVQNYGTAAAGEFEVSYYLSEDSDYDAAVDVELGSRIVSSLAVDSTNYGTVELELIQPAGWAQEGQFHIVMLVDQANAIAEQSEESMASGATLEMNSLPISILSQGKPDIEAVTVAALTADSYSWSIDPQQPSVITIQYELENIGTAASDSFTVTFYMSANTLITAESDFELGSVTVNSMAAGGVLADFADFTLP
ncbi:MAG: hypothetical protein JW745_03615, partial [Sedimentisphaerales bacterium]|nr:hypothetical protein [Sedimentisphaerales bacterium]